MLHCQKCHDFEFRSRPDQQIGRKCGMMECDPPLRLASLFVGSVLSLEQDIYHGWPF